MPAVLVSWDWHGDEMVHTVSDTHQTVFGGPEHDIDLGDGASAEAWLFDGPAGWVLRRRDGRETAIEHGDQFHVRRHRFQFLVADEVARALDEDRYLRTVLDPLTGVFNRRFLYVHGPRAMPAALLLVDLDMFKSFNDQHGHLVGDVILQQLAARLRDAVSWPEHIVRYGGEELVALLPGVSLTPALARAEAMRQAIDEPFDVEGEALAITISIGVAITGAGEDALDEALRAADANLMRAKERGRNRVAG